MGKTQDFWAMLEGQGGPVQPAEVPSVVVYEAKAEARCFARCLHSGTMSLAEICATIGVSRREAAELAAFIEKYPSEKIIVMAAIEFRSLVAENLDKLLCGRAG